MMQRRDMVFGLLVTPAIVRAKWLMPISSRGILLLELRHACEQYCHNLKLAAQTVRLFVDGQILYEDVAHMLDACSRSSNECHAIAARLKTSSSTTVA